MSQKNSNRGWSSQGRDGLPDRLRRVERMRMEFEGARDPSLKAQRAAMGKSEAKRREEQGEGSQMVKLHKPFPDLRPKTHAAQQGIRQSFNNHWHAEQNRAAKRQDHNDAFDRIDQSNAERITSQQQNPERNFER